MVAPCQAMGDPDESHLENETDYEKTMYLPSRIIRKTLGYRLSRLHQTELLVIVFAQENPNLIACR